MDKVYLLKNENHSHLGVMRGEVGESSKNKKHFHVMAYAPDPATGQITMQVVPAPDGHTHNIEEVMFKKKKTTKGKTDEEWMRECVHLARTGWGLWDDYRTRGVDSEKFYLGGDGQWTKDVLAKLQEKNQAHITLNFIKRIVNVLHGWNAQNDNDIKISPENGGSQEKADMLTHLVMHETEKNDYQFEKGDVFLDECITGMGNIHVSIDGPRMRNGELVIKNNVVDGRLKIERWPWNQCFYGPFIKKDASDAEYAGVWSWISTGKLKSIAPDKIDLIEKSKYFDGTGAWAGFISYDKDEITTVNANEMFANTADYVDVQNKRLKHYTIYKTDYDFDTFIVDMTVDDGVEINLADYEISDKQKIDLLSIEGFEKITKSNQVLWEIQFSANVFISANKKDFRTIPLIPAIATMRGDVIQGKIDDLKDPQREKNKRRSSVSDQANKSGLNWFYDDNTFEEGEEDKFLDGVSGNGNAFKGQDVDKPPRELKGPGIDPSLVSLDGIATKDMEQIASVNTEILGMNSTANSGVLYAEKKNAALMGNEHVFQGMSLMQKKLGILILELIPIYMTAEIAYRILIGRHNDPKKPNVEVNGMPLTDYTLEQVKQIWDADDWIYYDVAVIESSHSPTKRIADFKAWTYILGQVQDPTLAEFLLELADVPPDQKLKLKAILDKSSQNQMAMQQMKGQVELQKTAMAQQGKQAGMQ